MSTSAEDAELSVAVPGYSVSDSTPPHHSHCSNGALPGSAASGNGTSQLPCEKQLACHDKQRTSQKKGTSKTSTLQKKSTGMLQNVSVSRAELGMAAGQAALTDTPQGAAVR